MTEALIDLTEQLNQVLMEENVLLNALDFRGATGLLTRKLGTVDALKNSLSTGISSADLTPENAEKLRQNLYRLMELGNTNRSALELGLELQMRLIQTIARAVPIGRALEAPVYQPNGSKAPAQPPEAYAFRSRM